MIFSYQKPLSGKRVGVVFGYGWFNWTKLNKKAEVK